MHLNQRNGEYIGGNGLCTDHRRDFSTFQKTLIPDRASPQHAIKLVIYNKEIT